MPADGSFPTFDTARPSIDLPEILSLSAFMATFKTPDYIVDGIIQRGRLYALTSPTGHGKTAVTQYVGCCIAAGRNIGNIDVAQGAVVFLAGENPDDLCVRMHAACQCHGIEPGKVPLFVMAGNFPLSASAAEVLKERINKEGIEPALVIFDTAASFFPGDDDNHNVQMGTYARNLRVLTTCDGHPAVLVPAHPTKNPDKDNLLPRGGGAFLNELDGNLTLWADVPGEAATLHWHGKLRGADFAPVKFALQQVKITSLQDQRGRPIVSVVATLQSADQADAAETRAVCDENTVLDMLRRCPGISIRNIALNAGWTTQAGSPHTSKVHRLLLALERDKLVTRHRRKWKITEAGKKELAAE
jgi:hypothetical protein